jgi:DNA-binding NtrC family response regulator
MTHVLLAGKDWTARTLLRAQLIEEGLQVEAHESIRAAVKRLWASKVMPGLFVADLYESGNPAGDVLWLSQWSRLLPIWVIAGHGIVDAAMLEGRGFEKVFFRPLDVGKLVREIKARVVAE